MTFSMRAALSLAIAGIVCVTACRSGTPARLSVSPTPVCVRTPPTLPSGCSQTKSTKDVDPELRAAIEPVRHALFERERSAVQMAWSLANGPLQQSLSNETDDSKKQELEDESKALAESRSSRLAEIDERERCLQLPEMAPELLFDGEVVVFHGSEPTGYEPRAWVEVVRRSGCEWRAVSGGVPNMTPQRAPGGRRLMVSHYRVDQCSGGCVVLELSGDALTQVGDVQYKAGDASVCNLPKDDSLEWRVNGHGELEGLSISRASSSSEEYRWGLGGKLVRVK